MKGPGCRLAHYPEVAHMDAVLLTVPIALGVAFVFLGIFYWAWKRGQFDNPEGPAERMIHNDDDHSQS
mgnify:CR=1 FL=1